ncbi:MAG: tRNA pseudouridine(55) synthase TruB [Candidatus Liptonbacteria bacterium]|nr:tRNA pseudouridine(55) synthase TruB [Candidatus Liptonbacteria bacterium]
MHNILLIDKPSGITSFDVIRRLRRKFRENGHSAPFPKMGHAGTLDPLATGLMIVAVGEGTKKLQEYLKLPKVYEAEVMLGMRTDTGDREGKVLEKLLITNFEFLKESSEGVLKSMVGKIMLPVPKYSAIKVGGKRLYAKARQREEFTPPEKEMEVIRITFQGICQEGEGVVLKFETEVASGTYIRSLAEEIGKRVGVPATLWSLRRTQIGTFRVENAEKI